MKSIRVLILFVTHLCFEESLAFYPSNNSIGWVHTDGSHTLALKLPVVGFENNVPLYLCRARFDEKIVPGKLMAENGPVRCCVPDNGIAYVGQIFEVLYFHPGTVNWKKYEGSVTINTIEGGYKDNTTYYVCRTLLGDDLIPGMLEPDQQSCYVVLHGVQYDQRQNVEVLMRDSLGVLLKTKMMPAH